jgi:signal transduction histidine kinase
VNPTTAPHRSALRVAAIATVVVMAGYILAAFILNMIIVDHLLHSTDVRLTDRLQDMHTQALASPYTPRPAPADADLDDAPSFIWLVGPSGVASPLVSGAPALPTRHWTSNRPETMSLHGSTFRFDAIPVGGNQLVAGQSLASTDNVHSTLLVAERVFGAILAIAVFAGATIVGLRASAPSELVRRRQAEFTADASHELRTPISVIEAEVDLALDRPRDAEAYQEVLQRVGAESERLRRIVEDLLWLARADDEPLLPDSDEVVDVAAVAEACVQRFGAVATTREVTLSVSRFGVGPFGIEARRDWIDRLTGVLIDNACKFAGSSGRVEVSVRCSSNRVELRVDDSGPGIAADQRDAVFDRFHRADDSAAGTGLGLAIADSVVRATGGTWHIGVADLGGARMEISWRKAPGRRARPTPRTDKSLTQSLA